MSLEQALKEYLAKRDKLLKEYTANLEAIGKAATPPQPKATEGK